VFILLEHTRLSPSNNEPQQLKVQAYSQEEEKVHGQEEKQGLQLQYPQQQQRLEDPQGLK
jgi:hypothetical protein